MQWRVAAKYDAFEFKEKLFFSEAKAYAIQSLKHALQLLACKELVILDFGSGDTEEGPFPFSTRQSIGVKHWVAVDIASVHIEANNEHANTFASDFFLFWNRESS